MKTTRIAAIVLLLSAVFVLAAAGGNPLGSGYSVAAPLPPDDHAALAAAPLAEPRVSEKAPTLGPVSTHKGFIPPPLDYSHLSVERLPPGVTAQDLLGRWDWRENGGVTPPKNQEGCGSCYAFGAIGNIESRILVDGGPAYDFSENHAKECNWEARTNWTEPAPTGPTTAFRGAVALGATFRCWPIYSRKPASCSNRASPMRTRMSPARPRVRTNSLCWTGDSSADARSRTQRC